MTLVLLRIGCGELNKTGRLNLEKQMTIVPLKLFCIESILCTLKNHYSGLQLQRSCERMSILHPTRPETHTNFDEANRFNEFYEMDASDSKH